MSITTYLPPDCALLFLSNVNDSVPNFSTTNKFFSGNTVLIVVIPMKKNIINCEMLLCHLYKIDTCLSTFVFLVLISIWSQNCISCSSFLAEVASFLLYPRSYYSVFHSLEFRHQILLFASLCWLSDWASICLNMGTLASILILSYCLQLILSYSRPYYTFNVWFHRNRHKFPWIERVGSNKQVKKWQQKKKL